MAETIGTPRLYPIKGSEEVQNGHKTRRCIKCHLSYAHSYLGDGYYARIAPVTIIDYGNGNVFVREVLFSGRSYLLIECKRQSPKRQAEAMRVFEKEHRTLAALFVAGGPDCGNIDFDHPEGQS